MTYRFHAANPKRTFWSVIYSIWSVFLASIIIACMALAMYDHVFPNDAVGQDVDNIILNISSCSPNAVSAAILFIFLLPLWAWAFDMADLIREFGYSVAAVITGAGILSVKIGRGKTLHMSHLGEMMIEFGQGYSVRPVAGPASGKHLKVKQIFILLASPAANLVAATALAALMFYPVGGWLWAQAAWMLFIAPFFTVNAFFAIEGIIPRSFHGYPDKSLMDGQMIWDYLAKPEDYFTGLSPVLPGLILSEMKLTEEDYSGAEEVARRSLEKNPENVPLKLKLGWALIEQGKATSARQTLASALSKPCNPDELRILHNAIALTFLMEGKEDALNQAISHCDLSLFEFPKRELPTYIKASALIELGRIREGLEALSPLSSKQFVSIYHAYLALGYFLSGEKEKAREMAEWFEKHCSAIKSPHEKSLYPRIKARANNFGRQTKQAATGA